MALVSRRDRRLALGAGAMALGAAANQQLATITPRAIQQVARAVAQQLQQRPSQPKRQHKREKKANSGGSGGVISGPSRNITKNEKRAVTFSGSNVLAMTNGASVGVSNAVVRLALDTSDGWTSLSQLNGKLTNLRTMYRHWRLIGIKFSFIPSVTDATGGCVVMGFDADPYAGLPTTVSEVYNKEVAVMSHIRHDSHIQWKPFSARDREERYCMLFSAGTPTNLRPFDSTSFGTLAFYSSNTLAASTMIGYLKYDYVIAFDEEI